MTELTCIACPVGCRLTIEEKDGALHVLGNRCARGQAYAKQEAIDPQRAVTTLVRVRGGIRPVVAVKTRGTVSKAKIDAVLRAARALLVDAPIRVGDMLAENIGGSGAALVATADLAKDVPNKQE